MKLTDTADEVASLDDCLKSTRNRVEIALIIHAAHRDELLPTILEDLYCGTQLVLDQYCVALPQPEALGENDT